MFATSAVEVSLMKWIFEKLPSPLSLYIFCKNSEDDFVFLCFPAKIGLIQKYTVVVQKYFRAQQNLLDLNNYT